MGTCVFSTNRCSSYWGAASAHFSLQRGNVARQQFCIALTLAFGLCVATFSALAQPVSVGTGFVITQDGVIVTCYHVLEGNSVYSVRDFNGKEHRARLIAKDLANDLALLEIDVSKTPFLSIRRSSDVRKGEEIFALGFPNIRMQGLDAKVTQGIVSSISGVGGEPNSFQISAAVQPGNSGGPLVDRAGYVIGIVSAKLSHAAALKASGALPENVNYAVKSNYLIELLGSTRRTVLLKSNNRAQASAESPASMIARTEKSTVLVIARPADVPPSVQSSSPLQVLLPGYPRRK
jgi:S1-C subfamily serine protease